MQVILFPRKEWPSYHPFGMLVLFLVDLNGASGGGQGGGPTPGDNIQLPRWKVLTPVVFEAGDGKG